MPVQLTVFTPAYNRAHTLPGTYESLCQQDCRDFIWLIVDDGSTDGTDLLVQSWQQRDKGFEIRYIYKENGGMHTAHNTAYEHIDTELNVCIDSDDRMAEGAVAKIINFWNSVKDNAEDLAGIIGLDADFSGKIIGKGFPKESRFTTLSGYYAVGGKGDKKLVYRTDVMREMPPYPVYPGEKYNSLAYKYLMCDQKYRLAVLNEVLCLVDYQPDGSTANMFRQYLANPKGFAFTRITDMIYYPASKKRMFMTGVHYCSSSIIARNKYFIRESPRKLLTICCIPFGLAFTEYIRLRVWIEDCRGRKN